MKTIFSFIVPGHLIKIRFVHQDDEEYSAIRKARRPGRGPSAREDMLKMKIQALEKEQQKGFCKISLAPYSNFHC